MTIDLEDTANSLELQGRSAEADALRRIALERADEVARAIRAVEGLDYRSDSYRQALKAVVARLKERLIELVA